MILILFMNSNFNKTYITLETIKVSKIVKYYKTTYMILVDKRKFHLIFQPSSIR